MSDAVTSDSSASRAAFARALRGCAPFALFAFAFAIRAIRWREVFVADRVVPIGFDVYYHLRRISVSVFRHPAFLDFDAYLHFPDGAQPIWPPLFDRAVAAVLRPLVSKELESGLDSMERLAMWVPPVLGALTVVVVFELTRRHFGFRAGLLAGTVLSFLSGHVWYSQLGFLDHHVAVALFAALVLGSALRMVASMDAGRRGASWAWAVALGGSGAGALLLWPGSLLHIGLVHVALLADMLRRPSVGARALAARLAAAHAVALVTVAPSGLAADWLQWSAFSPVVVSRFQPLLFALATLVCGSCALVWSTPGRSGSLGRRLAVFCSVGTLGSVISLVAQPEILEGAQDAWRWLAKDEAFQSQVVESIPLFFEWAFHAGDRPDATLGVRPPLPLRGRLAVVRSPEATDAYGTGAAPGLRRRTHGRDAVAEALLQQRLHRGCNRPGARRSGTVVASAIPHGSIHDRRGPGVSAGADANALYGRTRERATLVPGTEDQCWWHILSFTRATGDGNLAA
jgi:hypothetical protein